MDIRAWRPVAAIAAGTLAGLALFSTAFYVWIIFGADPNKDPLVSW